MNNFEDNIFVQYITVSKVPSDFSSICGFSRKDRSVVTVNEWHKALLGSLRVSCLDMELCRLGISCSRMHPQPPTSSPSTHQYHILLCNAGSSVVLLFNNFVKTCFFLPNYFVLFSKELIRLSLFLTLWLILLSHRVLILTMYVPYFMLIVFMGGTI